MIEPAGSTHTLEQVRAAQSGDAVALSQLWEHNRRWVAAVVLAHKPRQVDLEDLLQDIAMTMCTRIDTLRVDANFRAWLRQVAVNAARAAGRSSRVRDRVDRELRLTITTSTDGGCPVDDETERLLGLVDGLPDEYREPLMLRAVHGLRSKQIAEILDVSEAVVDTRVARARRMIRERARDLERRGPALKWTGRPS